MNVQNKAYRILWVDILNICACFGVLVLHTSNQQVHHWNGICNFEFWWGITTHTVVYWPVPVFLMLSGFNLLNKNYPPQLGWRDFYKRRLLKTFLPFLIWSLIYSIPQVIGGKISLGEFFEYFAQSKFNGYMWFFIPLFAFYISIPVLSAWLKTVKDRELLWYLFIIFGMLYVIQPVYRYMEWGFFRYSIVPVGSSLLLYPLLGYAINKLPQFNQYRRCFYIVGLISAILHFTILSYSIVVLGFDSHRYQNTEEATSVLMAIAVFLWFMNCDWGKVVKKLKISPSVISKVSSCSLGIYLLQLLLFVLSGKLGLPLQNPYIGALLTYCVALLVVMVMKKIPVLKYIVP